MGKHAIRNVAWRGQVESRVKDLEDDLEWARARSDSNAAQERIAQRNIELAHEIASGGPSAFTWTMLRRWASGADIEAAWSAIHNAEAALIMILPKETIHARLRDLRDGLTATLQGDGRLTDYTNDLKTYEAAPVDKIGAGEREQIRAIRVAIDGVSDNAHLNIRNYRNWLLIVGAVVTLSLIGVAVAHSRNSEFLFIPEGSSKGHVGADVAQLEAAGAVGGLLMALFALIRLQVFSGPVALPLWQALIRIPAGAAAGLVGSILLQARVLSSLTPQDRSSLIGYAVLFGAAPELVLRFLDKQINNATAAARPQNDPIRNDPTQTQPAAPEPPPTKPDGTNGHADTERTKPEHKAAQPAASPPRSELSPDGSEQQDDRTDEADQPTAGPESEPPSPVAQNL